MQYHEDEIQWLKENIRGQGGWVYIYTYSTPIEIMMIQNLLHDNIIKFDGKRIEPDTGALLRYVLTPIGDVVMGIAPTEDTAPHAAPLAEDVGTGRDVQAAIMEYFAQCDPYWHDGKRTPQMVYEKA